MAVFGAFYLEGVVYQSLLLFFRASARAFIARLLEAPPRLETLILTGLFLHM